MTKNSIGIADTYLRFLRYYLLGVLDTCRNAKNSPIQFDLIELYSKAALDLVNELSHDSEYEDPNDITNEI
jgi:hypothetical protein